MRYAVVVLAVLTGTVNPVWPDQRIITLAATTSTAHAGLFDHVVPLFEADAGIGVRVIAAGTGQAIRYGERGDVDVLLVHHRASEERFVRDGFGLQRHDVMHNAFVIAGPEDDPAGVRGMRDAVQALSRIAATRSAFVSRGDDSGTHKRELELWRETGSDPAGAGWYRETGSGQGATLNVASSIGAYCLTDRATWLNHGKRGDTVLLVAGDPRLLNQYGIVTIDPQRHPHVDADAARAFVRWLLSPPGQAAINGFRINGEQAFFANASGDGNS